MGRLVLTYLEAEDELTLKSLEDGEATVPLPNMVLRIACRITGEGFKISLSTFKEEATLRTLVVKDAGPAALRLAEDLAERVSNFSLSWNGRDLKIEKVKLNKKPLELYFVKVPIDVGSV